MDLGEDMMGMEAIDEGSFEDEEPEEGDKKESKKKSKSKSKSRKRKGSHASRD